MVPPNIYNKKCAIVAEMRERLSVTPPTILYCILISPTLYYLFKQSFNPPTTDPPPPAPPDFLLKSTFILATICFPDNQSFNPLSSPPPPLTLLHNFTAWTFFNILSHPFSNIFNPSNQTIYPTSSIYLNSLSKTTLYVVISSSFPQLFHL